MFQNPILNDNSTVFNPQVHMIVISVLLKAGN